MKVSVSGYMGFVGCHFISSFSSSKKKSVVDLFDNYSLYYDVDVKLNRSKIIKSFWDIEGLCEFII
jgi:hypothetical protein